MLGQLGITPFALVHQPTKDERWAAYGTRIFKQRDKEDTSLLYESKLDLWERAAAKKDTCYLK